MRTTIPFARPWLTDEDRAAQAERQTDTHATQPALGVVELGFLAALRRLGIEPDMTAGHSYGELAALCAAGVLSEDDFLELSEVREEEEGGRVVGLELLAQLHELSACRVIHHSEVEQSVIELCLRGDVETAAREAAVADGHEQHAALDRFLTRDQ